MLLYFLEKPRGPQLRGFFMCYFLQLISDRNATAGDYSVEWRLKRGLAGNCE